MSIIQEALKKVQANVAKKDMQMPAQPEAAKEINTSGTFSENRSKNDMPSHSNLGAYLIAAFVALLVITIWQVASKRPEKISRSGQIQSPLPASSNPQTDTKYLPLSDLEIKPIFTPSDAFKTDAAGKSPGAIAPSNIVLSGIMYLEGGPRAMLNNSIVAEGETVDGYTVLKINRRDVVLKSDNSEITLELK